MQHSTKKRFVEQLPTTTSEENAIENKENSSKEELGTFELIPQTPFFIVGNKEEGFAAIMGKFRITEKYATKEQLIEYVYMQPYELLITIMSGVFDLMTEIKDKRGIEAIEQPKLFNE